MVTIQNLHKAYLRKKVLQGINLTLVKGKVIGIVGENGAGKTTLFKCIAGLTNFEGTITSDCMPLKNHLGFLPTHPQFLSRITGWEYLKLICIARGIQKENFEESNIFDLPLQQYADSYSTGMQKKLALLGILLQKNDIFILDEPFNGVDIQSNILIVDIIKQLQALHKIVVISSHIFSTLADTCDEIHLLREGNFVKSVSQEGFQELNQEMKGSVIGDKIQKLDLK